ncbi:hypothetical protein QXH22_21105 [Mycobacterium sp. TY814]|nr:hypothetical protein [Mycobacterium sp. TY814]MDP7724775.1 hypothetical protein [Mycobacterium sp. TY814]
MPDSPSSHKAFVAKVLATAPPLTPEQRTKLAELLRPVRIKAAS